MIGAGVGDFKGAPAHMSFAVQLEPFARQLEPSFTNQGLLALNGLRRVEKRVSVQNLLAPNVSISGLADMLSRAWAMPTADGPT